MMTKKQFWQRASNWGLICGAGLFVMNLVSWALGLEAKGQGWGDDLLQFLVICPILIYTGRQNARLAGAEGYSYSRAVGFVFAVMLFAGIVYGVGRFLMVNYIARGYYDPLNQAEIERAAAIYRNTPLAEPFAKSSGQMLRLRSNPIVLIIVSIMELVIKGGFLGLILGAFLQNKPDIFAAGNDTASVNRTGDATDGDEGDE